MGIGLFPEEVLSDDFDGSPRMLATPALTAKVQELAGGYLWQGLRLSPGTSVDEGIRAYQSILDDGFQVNIQRTDTQIDRVQRSVRPVAVALGVFGAAAALATLALGGLGAVRLLTAAGTTDSRVLRALGLSRTDRLVVAAAPPAVAAVVGALGAVAIAARARRRCPRSARCERSSPSAAWTSTPRWCSFGGAAIAVLVGLIALVAAWRARACPAVGLPGHAPALVARGAHRLGRPRPGGRGRSRPRAGR